MLNIKSIVLFVLLASTATSNRLGEPNDDTRRLRATSVNLGTAGDYAILTKAGVTTTGVTSIIGNVGTSPIAGTAITGFGLIMDPTNLYSTSSVVVGGGKIYAANYGIPTPSKMITAISDMETAYMDAAGRVNPNYTELGAGNIEGKTLEPGLYKWGSNVHFTSSLTFDGNSTDIWILQIAQNLEVSNGARVILSGGAVWENIYWQVSGAAVLGTTSHVEGVFLVKTGITFYAGSSLNGAALAQTAVTLDTVTIANNVTIAN
mmetsp:Transcript_7351/g.8538  ORF Transcript_7351/g.8538 Transcript_7351/m.8538 type:complete len:262 (+) Transcript_7351:448-1233(+)